MISEKVFRECKAIMQELTPPGEETVVDKRGVYIQGGNAIFDRRYLPTAFWVALLNLADDVPQIGASEMSKKIRTLVIRLLEKEGGPLDEFQKLAIRNGHVNIRIIPVGDDMAQYTITFEDGKTMTVKGERP